MCVYRQTPFDSEKDFYVDKTLAKGKYLVEAQTYRPEFIDLPFTCDDDTKLETISFEVRCISADAEQRIRLQSLCF